MKNNNYSAPISHLALKKFHIVPIKELDPASLKISAKKAKFDREKIKYNTLLNAIAKSLAVKGGFAEYQRFYDSELVPFLKKNGLTKRVDLLKHRLKRFDLPGLHELSHQNVSERIFYSGLELPHKIFTGYNFDCKHTIENGDDYFRLKLCKSNLNGPAGLKNYLSRDNNFGFNIPNSEKKYAIENNINIARKNPNVIIDCKIENKPLRDLFDMDNDSDSRAIQAGIENYNCYANRTLLDIVVGSFLFDLGPSFNLLGDSLVKPVRQPIVVELYRGGVSLDTYNEEKDLLEKQFELFRERIDQSDDGWVDVIPFNENLVFLKGGNGEYDFVFKNQRNQVFDHQIFGSSLKRADVPSCITDYQYSRWFYFEYKGWRQMDAHSAEHHYYDKGNTVEDYPSRSVVIKNYYEDLGYFSHPKEITHRKLTDFVEVNLIGKRLMISPLISINELNKFIAERPDYIDYRGGDILSSVNNEEDLTLPASVTWFDAMAYLNWFEETRKTPARLLTAHEYSLLRAKDDITKAQESQASDLNFLNLNSEGDVLFQSNSYISTDNYPLAVVRFGNVNRYTNSFGIEFMCSNSFAEWLMEETCIRSGSLKSFYHNDNVIRSRPSASSTGAYKGVKTGFRICYELDF